MAPKAPNPPKIPDLWPAEFGTGDVMPPLTIMRAQATSLARKTRGVVEGKITSQPRGTLFLHRFYLVAPVLGDYEYQLFAVQHEIELYPCSVSAAWDKVWHQAKDQNELLAALALILANEKTVRVVNALLAQSQQSDPDEVPS